LAKPENGLRLGIASSAQAECTASSLQEAAPLDITHKAVARRRRATAMPIHRGMPATGNTHHQTATTRKAREFVTVPSGA